MKRYHSFVLVEHVLELQRSLHLNRVLLYCIGNWKEVKILKHYCKRISKRATASVEMYTNVIKCEKSVLQSKPSKQIFDIKLF